jgi:hypothetical protein
MEDHPSVDLSDQTKANHAMQKEERIVPSLFHRYLAERRPGANPVRSPYGSPFGGYL